MSKAHPHRGPDYYSQPNVVADRKKYYARSKPGRNHRRGWSHTEEQLVLNSELSDHDLALKIGRTVRAIQVKRTHLRRRNVA